MMLGRKPEYPEKTPGDELQKMPHTKGRRFKPQVRLEPAQQHWWQARKTDMLTVRPTDGVLLIVAKMYMLSRFDDFNFSFCIESNAQSQLPKQTEGLYFLGCVGSPIAIQ